MITQIFWGQLIYLTCMTLFREKITVCQLTTVSSWWCNYTLAFCINGCVSSPFLSTNQRNIIWSFEVFGKVDSEESLRICNGSFIVRASLILLSICKSCFGLDYNISPWKYNINIKITSMVCRYVISSTSKRKVRMNFFKWLKTEKEYFPTCCLWCQYDVNDTENHKEKKQILLKNSHIYFLDSQFHFHRQFIL